MGGTIKQTNRQGCLCRNGSEFGVGVRGLSVGVGASRCVSGVKMRDLGRGGGEGQGEAWKGTIITIRYMALYKMRYHAICNLQYTHIRE